jgi:hypothetical protein
VWGCGGHGNLLKIILSAKPHAFTEKQRNTAESDYEIERGENGRLEGNGRVRSTGGTVRLL